MNHEQSKRVITEDHHSGPPIDMAKKTVCLQKQPPQCKVHLEVMKNEEKHFWDKHLKTFHKTLYLLYFWFIRYFWDVKIVKTFSEKEVVTEQLLPSDVMPALGKCLWAAPVEGHLQPLCHFGCTELRLWAYSTFQEATKIQQIHCSM